MPQRVPIELLTLDTEPAAWRFHKYWALARLTGCWLAPAIDGHGFQAHLAGCPLCPAIHVTIRHALCRCPATLPLYQALAAVIQVPARTCEELFLFALFSHEQPMGSRTAFISFVGRALQAGVRSMLEAAVDMDEADADQADLDDHIVQLLAAAQHGHG